MLFLLCRYSLLLVLLCCLCYYVAAGVVAGFLLFLLLLFCYPCFYCCVVTDCCAIFASTVVAFPVAAGVVAVVSIATAAPAAIENLHPISVSDDSVFFLPSAKVISR